MTTITADLQNFVGGRPDEAVLLISGPAIKFDDGTLVNGATLRLPFDSDGLLAHEVPASGTGNTDPAVWPYTFQVKWSGGELPPFSVEIPESVTPINLGILQPVNPTSPEYLPTPGTATLDDLRPGIANAGPLRAYGNSYLGTPGTAVSNWFNRLRRRLGSKTWANYGVNGARAADICSFAYGTVALSRQGTAADEENATSGVGTWTPGPRVSGITILQMSDNDAFYDGVTTLGGTTAKSRAGFTNALDAMIRLMRAASIRDNNDASITYGGTWIAESTGQTASSGARNRSTSTVGATATFTAQNGDALILLGYDQSGIGLAGSPWTLTADGQPYASGDTNNQTRRTSGGVNVGYGQLAIPITGLSAGSHTMVLTKAGVAGAILSVDCIVREAAKPQTVIVNKRAYLSAAGYAEVVALGGLTASRATDDVYNALIDTVVARFPNDGSVIVWDPNAAGFNADTMIGNADGFHVHLNDLGMEFYADHQYDLINALPARDGLVLTT